MDVDSIISLSSAMAQERIAQAAGIAVLKKAIDMQGSSALQLLAAVTQTGGNNPAHLGSQVDTFA